MTATIASHQLRSLRRQRVLLSITVVMVGMTALAGFIGWSSHQTITRVYDQAVLLLPSGADVPPNPFELKPTLSLLSNLTIYISLVGALLCLAVGHVSMAEDEADGIGRLVFSRQISRLAYFGGRLLGCAAAVAGVLAASWVVSVLALMVANGDPPGAADLLRLTAFYALSWLYLIFFVLVGMITVLLTRRRSLALLSAIGVWLTITFAVPQITSGLRPTTSLSPVTDPVGTSQAFFQVTSHAEPLSLAGQYKQASVQILDLSAGTGGQLPFRLLTVAGGALLLALLTGWLVVRHDYSRGASDG